ncbi:general stress protein [Microbacterium trichothecenolyticum]
MTMMGGRSPQGSDAVGQTVASFPTYEAAQKAVSSLIAADIPARDIAIVGQGLRSIERITGRLGYASAARSGAVNGLLLGLLFSAILVIGSPSVPIQAFVGVLFVGIAIGMLLSIVAYSFVRRRRDYASVMQVVADHYEVTVTDNSIGRARQVLGPQSAVTPATPVAPSGASTPPRPAQPTEPPKYGERVAPEPETEIEPDGEPPAGPGSPATPEQPSGPDQPADSEPTPGAGHKVADAERADDGERA